MVDQIVTRQSLQFTIEATKEYYLKILYELSLKSVGQIPQLEESNEEQELWIERKMKEFL
jgi:hypothetical protein